MSGASSRLEEADVAGAARAEAALRRVEHVDAQVTRIDGALAAQHGEIDALDKALRPALRDLDGRVTSLESADRSLWSEIRGTGSRLAGEVAQAHSLAAHLDVQLTRLDGAVARSRHRLDRAVGLAQTGLYMRKRAGPAPLLFLVTSYGYAASRWFAAALNRHPDILCSHGSNSAKLGLVYDREFTRSEWRRIWKEMPARRAMSLDAFFDELQSAGAAKAYGNVHHYRIGEVHSLLEERSCARRFRCCDLIRHPVTVIESRFQAHTDPHNRNNLFDHSLAEFHESLSRHVGERGYDDLVARYRLDLDDPEVAMFFLAVDGARWMTTAVQTYPAQDYVLMERLTTEPDYFTSVFDRMFGDELTRPESYVDEVFAAPPLNRHRRRGAGAMPAGDFRRWKAWQKALVRRVLEVEKVAETFARFGYDFDFAAGG